MKRLLLISLNMLIAYNVGFAQTTKTTWKWEWSHIAPFSSDTAIMTACKGKDSSLYVQAAVKEKYFPLIKRYDGISWEYLPPIPNNGLARSLCYGNHRLYAAGPQVKNSTGNPAVAIWDEDIKTWTVSSLPGNAPVLQLLLDEQRNILYALRDGGISVYARNLDSPSWKPLSGISNQAVQTMTLDNTGNLYIAGGMFGNNYQERIIWKRVISNSAWERMYGPPTLGDGWIFRLLWSKESLYLVGGNSGTVEELKNGKWKTLGNELTRSNAGSWHILTIAADSAGVVYTGGMFTDSGQKIYVGKYAAGDTDWSHVGSYIGHPYFIQSIVPSKNGILYAFGTHYGEVFKYGLVARVDTIQDPPPPPPPSIIREGVYPNPVIGQHLTIGAPIYTKYRMIDMLGRVCIEGTVQTEPLILDVGQLARGIYLVQYGTKIEKVVLQ